MNIATAQALVHCVMKPLLPLALFCSVSLVTNQPLQAQQIFDLGPKAGVSFDDLSSEASHTAVLGGHAGLFARVKPPLFPGVQGEVLLSTFGSDLEFAEATDAQARALAVQLPLFLVFSLGPAELHAGAYFNRTLTTNVEGGTTEEGVTLGTGDLEEDDHGILVGAGLHLGRIYAGIRYNHGLKDLGIGVFDDARNRQAQIHLAYGLFGE